MKQPSHARSSLTGCALLLAGALGACAAPAEPSALATEQDPAPTNPLDPPGLSNPADAGGTRTSTPDAGAPAAPLPAPIVVSPAVQAHLAECARVQAEGFPRTVLQAVARINGLSPPVSLPCFLAGLPRPLALVATNNFTSAQPADGQRSPRIFIMSEALILSVVPSGDGSVLLEFGEVVEPLRTLKAEIAFPVEAPLAPGEPFTQVLFDEELTTCGLCHRDEWPHESIEQAFVSKAYQLQPGTEVPISEVRAEHGACDASVEPYRCEMLHALFGFGPVQQGAFPGDFALFF